jgi:hypothetical protein
VTPDHSPSYPSMHPSFSKQKRVNSKHNRNPGAMGRLHAGRKSYAPSLNKWCRFRKWKPVNHQKTCHRECSVCASCSGRVPFLTLKWPLSSSDSFLGKVKSALAFLNCDIQFLAQYLHATVIGHLKIINARHDAWKVVVRSIRRLARLADHSEHGSKTLETYKQC